MPVSARLLRSRGRRLQERPSGLRYLPATRQLGEHAARTLGEAVLELDVQVHVSLRHSSGVELLGLGRVDAQGEAARARFQDVGEAVAALRHQSPGTCFRRGEEQRPGGKRAEI